VKLCEKVLETLSSELKVATTGVKQLAIYEFLLSLPIDRRQEVLSRFMPVIFLLQRLQVRMLTYDSSVPFPTAIDNTVAADRRQFKYSDQELQLAKLFHQSILAQTPHSPQILRYLIDRFLNH
jgi:hypothetical protein